MNTKHTPAPWQYQVIYKKGLGRIQVKGPKYGPLLLGNIHDDECNVPTCCRSEEHANAKLIAAAPELLEALEKIADGTAPSCEREAFIFVDIAKDIANQAIKKATE